MTVSISPPESQPVVRVLILNWNREVQTAAAVRSVQRLEAPNVRILVLDNASRAESLQRLRREIPEVEILETGANLGYAGGNNVGFREAIRRGDDYVLVMNNDAVLEPGAIDALLEVMHRDPAVAVAGADVFRADAPNRRFHRDWTIDWRKWLMRTIPRPPEPSPTLPFRDVAWVQGCAMMIRTAFLHEHGLFDERYHLYCEDADLCVRAQRAGFRTVEAARARVRHAGYASSGADAPLKLYYGLRNRFLFLGKWAPSANRFSLAWRLLVFDAGRTALGDLAHVLAGPERRRAAARLRALACAVRDAARRRWGPGPAWLFAVSEKPEKAPSPRRR